MHCNARPFLSNAQAAFESHIERLKCLDYDLLDVKAPRWHDDYATFTLLVKDLEVMYTNVINTAFEGVTRVADAVALLEVFFSLARRPQIKQTCLKKTVSTCTLQLLCNFTTTIICPFGCTASVL
jgi:dynein heavy chain, axonemal